MRQLRWHQWFAFVGLAALAIQFAAAFGHHHDHIPHSHESHSQYADLAPLVAGIADHSVDHGHDGHDHDGHEHGPRRHSDEDLCAICWSITTLASLAVPEIAQLAAPSKARLPKIPPPDASGVVLRIGRAHLPRGPPVRSC